MTDLEVTSSSPDDEDLSIPRRAARLEVGQSFANVRRLESKDKILAIGHVANKMRNSVVSGVNRTMAETKREFTIEVGTISTKAQAILVICAVTRLS